MVGGATRFATSPSQARSMNLSMAASRAPAGLRARSNTASDSRSRRYAATVCGEARRSLVKCSTKRAKMQESSSAAGADFSALGVILRRYSRPRSLRLIRREGPTSGADDEQRQPDLRAPDRNGTRLVQPLKREQREPEQRQEKARAEHSDPAGGRGAVRAQPVQRLLLDLALVGIPDASGE